MGAYAEKYRREVGDYNETIHMADLVELKERAMSGDNVADKAQRLVDDARAALNEKVSVLTFTPAAFNDLIDALDHRRHILGE